MQSFSMQGHKRVHHVNFLQPHQRGWKHFSLPEYSENSGKCISITLSTHVETVVKLSLKKDTPKIEVTMEPEEESNYTPEEKATYSKIKEYVKEKYGVNVHTSYIAQVKRMCGLDMGENYNKSKKENPEVKQCPQEKVEYIKDALRYFKLI
jgi:23S rRNA (uracil1939-C5)-methyltransferase